MAMRVFIGPVEIAGYYSTLAEGLRSLGVETSFICISDSPFGYEKEARTDGVLVRALRHGLKRRAAVTRKQLVPKLFWVAFTEACRAALFLWAASRHQVFVFGFGQSFYGFRELPVLKALKRRIICVYNGSDSRPPYIDGARLINDPLLSRDPHYLLDKTRAVKRMVERVDRYADVIVSAPPHALFETRPFVLYQAVGVPVRIPRLAPTSESQGEAPHAIRVLHCPSMPEAKGTPLIRAAVDSLKKKGLAIEYIEVTGKPNEVVLQELARCDFIVDQLYSDSPAATLVAEAAFFGKPAIVAGYCQRFVEELPKEYVPPTIYCSPEQIEGEIERLIVDASLRNSLGGRARAFVDGRWTPTEFAKRFLLLIKGETPAAWMCDPYEIDYVPIAAMSEAKARETISRLIDAHGVKALQLRDKPGLEALFVEFANTGRRGRAGPAA